MIICKSNHRQTDRQVGMNLDYNVYKDSHPDIPNDVERMFEFEFGFLGVEKDCPTEQKSSLPFKKEN
jgi:hypothetical protein